MPAAHIVGWLTSLLLCRHTTCTPRGQVFYTHLFHGEMYDARREQPGWDGGPKAADFTPSAPLWSKAVPYAAAAATLGDLSLFTTPPIVCTEERAPAKMYPTPRRPGSWTFDFGQNWAGFVRLSLGPTPLPAGTTITLKHTEITHRDGAAYNTYCGTGTCRGLPAADPGAGNQANQTDVYITRGVANETWTPKFTYHGFRYVELDGPFEKEQ